MNTSRGRAWRSAAAAGIKAFIWGIVGPPLLYAVVLLIVIVAYNAATKPFAEIIAVAKSTFFWSVYIGVVLAGPLGAFGALAVTWQAFRWTARGDGPRRITGKALALGAFFGFLVPIWIVLWLAISQSTTFSGRFDSLRTFIYMASNSALIALVSTWILLRLIRPHLRLWLPPMHA